MCKNLENLQNNYLCSYINNYLCILLNNMNEKITAEDRINLKKIMDDTKDYEDNTAHIRKVKHSENIRDEIRKVNFLSRHYAELKKNDNSKYLEICQNECGFLFNNYTDIFNRLVKDELDLSIMTQLLTVLKMIEDEKVDQGEGSVLVGKVLKKLYLDSAIKRGENIDKEQKVNEEVNAKVNPIEKISWGEYKERFLQFN
jgi:hypothetical protein